MNLRYDHLTTQTRHDRNLPAVRRGIIVTNEVYPEVAIIAIENFTRNDVNVWAKRRGARGVGAERISATSFWRHGSTLAPPLGAISGPVSETPKQIY